MEDGPEAADGSYLFKGRKDRLEENGSEVWSVFEGDRFVGDVIAEQVVSESGPRYTVRFPDDRTPEPECVE